MPDFLRLLNVGLWPLSAERQQNHCCDFSSAVDAKAVVNSEKSKIMPSTAANGRIAEVPGVALQWADNDPLLTFSVSGIKSYRAGGNLGFVDY